MSTNMAVVCLGETLPVVLMEVAYWLRLFLLGVELLKVIHVSYAMLQSVVSS